MTENHPPPNEPGWQGNCQWMIPRSRFVHVIPFSKEHLEEAAALVADQYRVERGLNASLPAQFEEPEAVLARLHGYANGRAGVAAIRQGKLAGFLVGLFISEKGLRMAYVPDWGHSTDLVDKRETYRAMYAALAPRWVANGYFEHAVTLLANDHAATDAWFSLGFGLLGIDALRDLSPVAAPSAEVSIRRATVEDIDIVLSLTAHLQRHLATSPTFMPMIFYRGREYTELWLSDPAKALWLAYVDGKAVGHMRLEPVKVAYAPLPVADETIVAISGAYTRDAHRSCGIGTALLKHSLEWARSAGYTRCAVDFESANIVGMDFWWRSGFRPVCYSLTRHVDERISWANEHRSDEDFLQHP